MKGEYLASQLVGELKESYTAQNSLELKLSSCPPHHSMQNREPSHRGGEKNGLQG